MPCLSWTFALAEASGPIERPPRSPWRGPCSRELRPAILEEGLPAPVRPSDDYSPGQLLASDLSREPELEPPSRATRRLPPCRSGEIRAAQCRAGLLCSCREGMSTMTYVDLFIQIFEEVLGSGCLGGARFTDQKNRLLDLDHLFQHPRSARCIHCMN